MKPEVVVATSGVDARGVHEARSGDKLNLRPRNRVTVALPSWTMAWMSNTNEHRVGAVCAVVGSVLLLVGTSLHPMGADPHDSVAAFTEYAADPRWVASHLAQLAGLALVVAALLILTKRVEAGPSGVWARLGAGGAVASLAVAAALQAVDGVALKVMVDAWAAAPAEQKAIAFQGAFAVRQIEVGLASMLGLLLGGTITLYGVALLSGRSYPKWMGAVAVLGGVPTVVGGIAIAYTGFSGLGRWGTASFAASDDVGVQAVRPRDGEGGNSSGGEVLRQQGRDGLPAAVTLDRRCQVRQHAALL